MDPTEIRARFRRVDRECYPLLSERTLDDIYDGAMGPGGLFLATTMSSAVEVKPGMRVMDLGCGRGKTSIFLATMFDITVYSVDLWIPATQRFHLIKKAGFENRVIPLSLDVTEPLPFPEEYFDIVFCMDAFHYFGANHGFIQHLAKQLRPSGDIVIGNPCFDREFSGAPPAVYQAFWDDEFSKYHSPDWWSDLFDKSGCFENLRSVELPDGVRLWEDELLYSLDTGNTKGGRLESDADEIVFGHENPEYPYLTHLMVTARRK